MSLDWGQKGSISQEKSTPKRFQSTRQSERPQILKISRKIAKFGGFERGSNNGILVLLLIDRGTVQITIGSGLAQQLSIQVIDSIKVVMADRFVSGDYYGGFERGFNLLMLRTDSVPWTIAYTSIDEIEHDSLRSIDRILSTDGMITGFEEDLVLLTDSDGGQARLIIPTETFILSIGDIIGFTGRIVAMKPVQIRVLSMEVEPAFY